MASSQTYQFNTCGATGRLGPNSCSYSGHSVNIIGEGIQEWSVPEGGKYRIIAAGGEGSDNDDSNGGEGAVIEGEFILGSSAELRILVGHAGVESGGNGDANAAGGGAGGTYVTKVGSGSNMFDGASVEPLIVAGGGGGAGSSGAGASAALRTTGKDGNDGGAGLGGKNSGGGGGAQDGSAGTATSPGGDGSSCSYGAGGGGFLTDGGRNCGGDDEQTQGISFVNGGIGGPDDLSEIQNFTTGTAAVGAFGAGAGAGHRAGGGGGYSGGGGSGASSGAGGGGSFINGEAENPATSNGTWDTTGSEPHNVYSGSVSDLSNWNSGHGYVEIELLATTSDPVLQTPTYTNYQASSSNPARFEVDAHVDIDTSVDSSNTLNSCSATVTGDNNGGSVSYTGTVSGDNCIFTVKNNDNSNWEPGESVTIDITATDDKSNTDTATFGHSFTNTPPTVQSVSPSDGASSVWGGENGVRTEAEVVDWESYHTNDDLTVDFVDDSLGQFGSVTVSNGDGTASVNWERNGEQDMFGFDLGTSYGWEVNVDDVTAATETQSQSFTVLSEASTSNPSPTGGESADQIQVDIDNPAVNTDGSLSGSIVEFWVDDGLETYQVNTDTVSGSSGTASISLQDFEFRNEPQDGTGDWFVKVNDTYSETDYSTSKYGSNTYSFSAAEAPLILPLDSSSDPIDETGVGLNPDLSIAVNDPDNSLMNVTFYQGSPGSDRLGEVQVSGGSGVATLPSSQHNLGSTAGSSFEWSVEAEDVEYNEVNQSASTYSVDIVDSPQVSFNSHNNGDTGVSVDPTLEAGLSQAQGYDLSWRFDVDGGGQNLSTSGLASGTSGGTSVSHDFGLESGSDYTWKVNASFNDEFGNAVWTQDSISFTTASAPSLLDFSPVDQADGQVDPILEVNFDNSGRSTTARFYNWENGNQLHEETGITNGIATFNTSTVEGFGGEARDTYFWYVRIIDEASGASYNSSAVTGNPWEFSTPNVLDARIDVVQGTRNLNPGSANLGPSSVEFRVSNNDSLDMDKAAVSLNGSNLANVSPVSEGESISVNIADEVSEDNSYDWSVDILEDGNLIAQTSREFSTYVISADWDKPSESVQDVSYNVYHSNEDTPFNFGGGDYSHIGEAYSTTVDIATTDLGYGSTDCFRITSENIVGESTDSAPPLGGNGECLGGNLE